jgi:hypothetical protein
MKRGQGKEEPVSGLDYNKNMGGVDLKTKSYNPTLWKGRK